MVVFIKEHNPLKKYETKLKHYCISIDKIHADTIGTSTIQTTVTSHHGKVNSWIKHTLLSRKNLYEQNCLVIGLGVRWTSRVLLPNHKPADPASTLQLCHHNRCLLFHLHFAKGCPFELENFLNDGRITFVGLYSQEYATRLLASRFQLRLPPLMPIDLRFFLQDQDNNNPLRNAYIPDIATRVLGLEIPSEFSHDVYYTDWEIEDLTTPQVAHACLDAFVAYAIGFYVVEAWQYNPNCRILAIPVRNHPNHKPFDAIANQANHQFGLLPSASAIGNQAQHHQFWHYSSNIGNHANNQFRLPSTIGNQQVNQLRLSSAIGNQANPHQIRPSSAFGNQAQHHQFWHPSNIGNHAQQYQFRLPSTVGNQVNHQVMIPPTTGNQVNNQFSYFSNIGNQVNNQIMHSSATENQEYRLF